MTTGAYVAATGLGSWPGTDVREALRVVRGQLAETPEGVAGLPYLPELPDRGPGADLIGRSAGLLADLPVDLQPQGWRLTDRPGIDAERTSSWWGQDLDELAEAFEGWTGRLKLQVAGPWTLAAGVWLPKGERVLSDAGATRELAESLAEGVVEHLDHLARLLPGAELVLQLDEPGLPSVLAGRVRSASGYRVLPAPEQGRPAAVLRTVLEQVRVAGASTVAVHCCAEQPPLDLLRTAGADALAVDTGTLDGGGWDQVAQAIEAGTAFWAGVLPATGELADHGEVAERLARRWDRLGLPRTALSGITLTPACGLAGADPEHARAVTARTVQAARSVHELAGG